MFATENVIVFTSYYWDLEQKDAVIWDTQPRERLLEVTFLNLPSGYIKGTYLAYAPLFMAEDLGT